MSPPAGSGQSIDVLLGELLARVTAMERRQEEQGEDVREARDLAKGIAAIMGEQRVGEQIAGLRSEMRTTASELRSDMVNAVTRTKAELGDCIDLIDQRVKVLEVAHTRDDGARSLIGWLLQKAPWLLSLLMAALAGFGLKDKIGH